MTRSIKTEDSSSIVKEVGANLGLNNHRFRHSNRGREHHGAAKLTWPKSRASHGCALAQYEGRTMAMMYSIESLALASISRFLPNNRVSLDVGLKSWRGRTFWSGRNWFELAVYPRVNRASYSAKLIMILVVSPTGFQMSYRKDSHSFGCML